MDDINYLGFELSVWISSIAIFCEFLIVLRIWNSHVYVIFPILFLELGLCVELEIHSFDDSFFTVSCWRHFFFSEIYRGGVHTKHHIIIMLLNELGLCEVCKLVLRIQIISFFLFLMLSVLTFQISTCLHKIVLFFAVTVLRSMHFLWIEFILRFLLSHNYNWLRVLYTILTIWFSVQTRSYCDFICLNLWDCEGICCMAKFSVSFI